MGGEVLSTFRAQIIQTAGLLQLDCFSSNLVLKSLRSDGQRHGATQAPANPAAPEDPGMLPDQSDPANVDVPARHARLVSLSSRCHGDDLMERFPETERATAT
jgi:hypothetical protein